MKATQLLINQHQEVARLFGAIESTDSYEEKRSLFLTLATHLCAHDGIERRLFYPACEEVMGLDELGEALVEHGVIEFSLYQATEALGQPDFDFKCKVLKEIVEHHVKEEQDELFPKAETALEPDVLVELAEEMKVAFEEACADDFRAPLYRNVKQVVEGALKPVPAA